MQPGDQVTREIAQASPSRAKRGHVATAETDRLYQQHTDRADITNGYRGAWNFRSVSQRRDSADIPEVSVPLRREVFTGRAGVSRPLIRGVSAHTGSPNPRTREGYRGARDRQPRGDIVRGFDRDANRRGGMRNESYYDSSGSPHTYQEGEGIQSRSVEGTQTIEGNGSFSLNGYRQERYARMEQQMDQGDVHENAPPRNQQFSQRSPFDRAPEMQGTSQRRPRRGGVRRGGDRDDDEQGSMRRTSRPKRDTQGRGGGSGGSSRSNGKKINIWNEAEQAYFRQREEDAAPKILNFKPADMIKESLSGLGPAVTALPFVMSQMLDEYVELAKRSLEGECIQWKSEEQKMVVQTLVKQMESQDAAQPQQNLPAWMQTLVRGQYDTVKKEDEKDVLGLVARYSGRNESYHPEDQKALLDKVGNILPAEALKRANSTARQT